MNRDRRKRIAALKLDEVKAELEALRDEEQEARDNLPESVADGERGEKMDSAIETLESLIDAIEEFTGESL